MMKIKKPKNIEYGKLDALEFEKLYEIVNFLKATYHS